MNELSSPERRLASNRLVSEILDMALTCRETLGEDAAKRILVNHNIPSTTSARVLFHAKARRVTERERSSERTEVSYPPLKEQK